MVNKSLLKFHSEVVVGYSRRPVEFHTPQDVELVPKAMPPNSESGVVHKVSNSRVTII